MKKVFSVLIILISILGLIGCSNNKPVQQNTIKVSPENVINAFFTELKKGNFEKADEYLVGDKKNIEKKDYEQLIEGEKASVKYWLEKIGYDIKSLNIISDNEANVDINISTLNGKKLYNEYKEKVLEYKTKYMSEENKEEKESDLKEYDKKLIGIIKNKNNEIITNKVNIKLEKKDDNWYIVFDDKLKEAMSGGFNLK